MKAVSPSDPSVRSVFDTFPWWDPRDVLLQITPARFAYLKTVSGVLSGQEVLDVGCGAGYLAEPLAKAGAAVTGIDVSAVALAIAGNHAKKNDLAIKYLQSAAEEMPLPDSVFDLAIAFDVLEHVASLPKTLSEIARTLKPGGKLIFDTNNRTFLSRLVMIWIGENLWPYGGPPKGTHDWRKFIKPRELIRLMANNGIQIREIKGLCPAGIDFHGRLKMAICRFQWLSYVGYGVKTA